MGVKKFATIQRGQKVKYLPHPALRATLCFAASVPLSRRARVCSPRPSGEGLGVREDVDLVVQAEWLQKFF